MLGIGCNVAVRERDLPAELRATAVGLGLEPSADRADPAAVAARAGTVAGRRSAGPCWTRSGSATRSLAGACAGPGGEGEAAGVDGDGRLIVVTDAGRVALEAGEVHLAT